MSTQERCLRLVGQIQGLADLFLSLVPPAAAATASYYDFQHPGLGAAFLAEVRKTRIRIAELPNAARTIRNNIRRTAIHKFPYYIIYRVSDDKECGSAPTLRKGWP